MRQLPPSRRQRWNPRCSLPRVGNFRLSCLACSRISCPIQPRRQDHPRFLWPLSTNTRDPEAMTDQLDATVEIFDRDYQRYSVDNSIYLIPVDDVCCRSTLYSACIPPYQVSRTGRKLQYWILRKDVNADCEQEEEQRLERQHQILRLVFENEMFHPDAPVDCRLTEVLDLGCGTCNWAIQTAEEKGCSVSGSCATRKPCPFVKTTRSSQQDRCLDCQDTGQSNNRLQLCAFGRLLCFQQLPCRRLSVPLLLLT